MKTTGIVETALYVEDVVRSARFYRELLGWKSMLEDSRIAALDAGPGQVLLLFRKGGSTEAVPMFDGVLPPHDGTGQNHLAFGIERTEFDRWCQRLTEQGIAIESTITWPAGGRSVYFRDPDGHLVELLTPGVWPNF